jgi:hypothetical protein
MNRDTNLSRTFLLVPTTRLCSVFALRRRRRVPGRRAALQEPCAATLNRVALNHAVLSHRQNSPDLRLSLCGGQTFVSWCPSCRRNAPLPQMSLAAGEPCRPALCALLFLEPYLVVNLALSCLTVSTCGHQSRSPISSVQLCRAVDVAHRRTHSTALWASSDPSEDEGLAADFGKSTLGKFWAFEPMEAL